MLLDADRRVAAHHAIWIFSARAEIDDLYLVCWSASDGDRVFDLHGAGIRKLICGIAGFATVWKGDDADTIQFAASSAALVD